MTAKRASEYLQYQRDYWKQKKEWEAFVPKERKRLGVDK
jgi:hypothetical protein